jgi:GT2 family glycosyltransferase
MLATVVVAVTKDRRLYRLLESLREQTVPQDEFEVVVVENGSAELADVASSVGGVVRYFHLPDANMAAAREVGLNAARGCYLLLTDADCVVLPDWIEQMVAELDRGEYAAVGGQIGKLEPRSWTQRYGITVVEGQTALNYLPALALPYVAGANAGFVTAALHQVGGFDSRFKSGNDVDVCYRLGLAGRRVGLAQLALVLHEDRTSVSAHFRRFKNYAIYQVLLFVAYRHISGRSFVINTYPFKRVARALASIPFAFVRLVRGDVAPASRALLYLVEALGVWCGDIQGSVRYRSFYL